VGVDRKRQASLKFLGRIFRYLMWFIVTAGIAWVMKKAVDRASRTHVYDGREPACVPPRATAKELFRDPVCGTYVAEDISYLYEQDKQTLHFCSRDCMEHYQRDLQHAGGRANRLAAGA
jgi:YHS domain-containing protein